MAPPEPKPSLVIRYDYLWNHEAAGRDKGKDCLACLVTANDSNATPRFVVILAITHATPAGDAVGIEIPPRVRQAIGLDDAPSWVIVSEHHVDEWPNGGLSSSTRLQLLRDYYYNNTRIMHGTNWHTHPEKPRISANRDEHPSNWKA